MRLSLLAAAALSLSSLAAHADTIQEYALTSVTLSNGASASGNVLFDETTGLFSGGSVYASLGNAGRTFNIFGGSSAYDTVTFANFYDAGGAIFQLIIPGNMDANYSSGALCTSATYAGCASSNGGVYLTSTSLKNGTNAYAVAGKLAPTPEPSSIALLGTGLVGMFGVARRRLARA